MHLYAANARLISSSVRARLQQAELPLHNLFERHPGVTEAIGSSYTEAARVCLDRHHSSPVELAIEGSGSKRSVVVKWDRTDDRTQAAWANEIETTEFGAYGIALAVVEIAEEMVAVRRAETQTGADYYVAPPDVPVDDFEAWFRLEVSGVDRGDELSVRQRLHEKVRQALKGASNLPALAAVVGFRAKLVAVSRAEAT